jgi:hypothetical protein
MKKNILKRLTAAALLAVCLLMALPGAALAADGQPAGGGLAVTAYEVSSPSIRRNDAVDLTMHFIMSGSTADDAQSRGLDVSRLVDSFSGGSQEVRITSSGADPLTFDVTFRGLVYSGSGKSFRVMAGVGGAFENAEITVREANEYEEPKPEPAPVNPLPLIQMSRSELRGPITAGQSFDLTVEFRNLSDLTLESPVASFSPSEALTLTDSVSSFPLPSIPGGRSGSVTVHLRANDTIASASQALNAELRFTYPSAGSMTQGSAADKISIPAQVAARQTNPQPMLLVTRSELTSPIRANQEFPLTITIQNLGKTAVANPIATFTGSDSLTILNSNSTFLMKDIPAGGKQDFTLRLKAAGQISSSTQSITADLKFTYDTGDAMANGSDSERVYLSAAPTGTSTGTRTDKPTPNLIVSSFAYGEAQIPAGGKFPLSIRFRNTSAQLSVENIVMTLDTGDSFAVDNTTNTYYYKSIAAGAEQEQSIPLQALSTAKTGARTVTASFKYEYVDGDRRASTNSSVVLSIPVFQQDRFEISAPTVPPAVNVNEELALSLNYVNKGKSEVSNVSASVSAKDGVLQAAVPTQNLGNFESGKSGTIGFAVTPLVTGDIDLTLVISYEDAGGQQQSRQFPVRLKAQQAPAADDETAVPEEPAAPNHTWLYVLLGSGVLVLPAVLLAVRRRRAKKKEAAAVSSGWENWDDGAARSAPESPADTAKKE